MKLQPAEPQAASPTLAAELHALLHGAAVASITDRALLRIAGPDATRWLNGMVTNNVAGLEHGRGNYNFILNAQGRILGDCTIYREHQADAFLLATDASQLDPIHRHLEKFIIMDDVELFAPNPAETALLLIGPKADHILTSSAGSPLPPAGGRASEVDLNGHRSLILTPESTEVPMYEIWFHSSESARHSFRTFKTEAGMEATPQAIEALRILSGTPRYGIDIRNTDTAHDLPQETGQTRALHFAKGCYLGQEIVERIRSRGKVHRAFSGFQLTGAMPAAGAALAAEGKPAGELTSVAAIPLSAGTVQLALGYVRREALDRALPIEYPGGTAKPITLPYEGIA